MFQCFNAGPPAATLAQHWNRLGYVSCFFAIYVIVKHDMIDQSR